MANLLPTNHAQPSNVMQTRHASALYTQRRLANGNCTTQHGAP